MRLLALIASLLLAGCWTGGAFYTPAESGPAIPPGDYHVSAPVAGTDGFVRVALQPDGTTLLTPLGTDGDQPDAGDATTIGFTPLGGRGGLFVAWVTAIEMQPLGSPLYGLLRQEGRTFRLVMPQCLGTEVLVRPFNAQVTGGPESVCGFADRAGLESALVEFAARGEDGPVVATLTPR